MPLGYLIARNFIDFIGDVNDVSQGILIYVN